MGTQRRQLYSFSHTQRCEKISIALKEKLIVKEKEIALYYNVIEVIHSAVQFSFP